MHGRPEKWSLANLAQHAPAEPDPTGKLTGVCVQPPQQHVPSPTSWPQQNFIFFPSSIVSLKMSQGFLTDGSAFQRKSSIPKCFLTT